jgi:hypothetical protein
LGKLSAVAKMLARYGKKIKQAQGVQFRRVTLLQRLLDDLSVAQENGEAVECIATALIKDTEAKLSRGKVYRHL